MDVTSNILLLLLCAVKQFLQHKGWIFFIHSTTMSKPPDIINPYIRKQQPLPKSNSTTEPSLHAAENESACSGNLKSAGGSSLQPPSQAYFFRVVVI